MTEHRYPPSAMVRDYMTSGAGLALSLPPMVMLDLPAVTVWILGAMSLAFAIHGLGVVRRRRLRVGIDEDGLSFSPPRRRIAWNEITRFRLAWFSTRRDGARGWMELKVASPSATLRVDSRLERFPELVGRAWHAASRRGLELDPATRANLEALGTVGGPGGTSGEPDAGGEGSDTVPRKPRDGREEPDLAAGGPAGEVEGRIGLPERRAERSRPHMTSSGAAERSGQAPDTAAGGSSMTVGEPGAVEAGKAGAPP